MGKRGREEREGRDLYQSWKKFKSLLHVKNFFLFFSLSLGASNIGINPKINNIYEAYQAARYNLLWISDSNILSKRNNLVNE